MNEAQYAEKKNRARVAILAKSLDSREIGAIPPIANPERRRAAWHSLAVFLRAYFPAAFPLEWGQMHRDLIANIQRIVEKGGQKAFAMPRGSGKSTICERAILWATFRGDRRYGVIVGATKPDAKKNLANIKEELATNELLLADWPEIVYPFRRLEGESRRCGGQIHHGSRTKIEWGPERVRFAQVPGSDAAGSIIATKSLDGHIRGLVYRMEDGSQARPDLVLLDDPQNDKVATNPKSVAKRCHTINGTVMGLGGPNRQIAAAMPCTIIAPGDLADIYLDRERSPSWSGTIVPLIRRWPDDPRGLWSQYATIYKHALADGAEPTEATEFYKANREEMDAGGDASWPDRFAEGELSAIQSAYNLRIRIGEAAFAAEYQQAPPRADANRYSLDPKALARRSAHAPRGSTPNTVATLTAAIDVQGNSLWWAVVAWSGQFGGRVVDYGVWPEQARTRFTLSEISPTIQDQYPDQSIESQIHAALTACREWLFSRQFPSDDENREHAVSRMLIDANWGQLTETVYAVSDGRRCLAGHGRYTVRTVQEAAAKADEIVGPHWRIRPGISRPHVAYDANYWKSFVAERLTTPYGDPRALMLPSGDVHTLCEHLSSETRETREHDGQTTTQWEIKQTRPDNHWWDCICAAAVAASIEGITLALPVQSGPKTPRKTREAEYYG